MPINMVIAVLVAGYVAFFPAPSAAQQAMKMSFQGIEVSVFNATWSSRAAQLTVRVKNITNEEGNPHEIALSGDRYAAKLTVGGAGGNFAHVATGSGAELPDGKSAENWIRLVPGGSVAVTYNFNLCCDMYVWKDGSYAGPQPPFNFSTQVKLYKFNGQPILMPVFIGPIGEAAKPQSPYPKR